MVFFKKKNSKKTLSENGLTLLKKYEAVKLEPYDDQTGKRIFKWCKGATIGMGHLILKSEWNKYKDGITIAQSNELGKKDLNPRENSINKNVKVFINQNQFDALVMLVYNIGIKGFKTSSVLKLINNTNAETSYDSLESAWMAWNKSQGKKMNGLVRRRSLEWELFNISC